MSGSTGQIIGTVVGGIIGAFVPGGYVALGAAIGGMVGGAIDPPKGPKIAGPKLSDLSVQTNTYGANIPQVWGTLATFGNIFWVENNQLKETTTSESQGGKGGGGGQEVETTTYSVTFALGLCQGPIDAVRRIWCSGKLIYDAGATDYEGIVASNLASGSFRLYKGTDDQSPDWRMQAALGVANVPAYRGLAYLVFDDFQLADFGNSILGAQFKVEVVTSAVVSAPQLLSDTTIRDDPYYWGTGIINIGGETDLATFQCAADEWYGGEQYKQYTCKASLSFFSSPGLYMDVPHAAPPAKYPWLTSALWLPGSSTGGNGWRYGAVNYLYDGLGTGVTDWVVLPSSDTNAGRLIMIRANVLEMYIPGSGVMVSYSVPGATQMYYTFGYIVVIATGTTWTFSTDLVLLYQASNSINMTDKMLGGSNSGGLYLMDQAGAQLGPNVYSLNGAVSTITGSYATEIVTSAGGTPAFYVRDGILIVAFVADPDPAAGHQVAFTVRRWGLGGMGVNTVNLSTIISDVCLASNLIDVGDIDVSAIDQQVNGYRITETAALRAALEPLQAAWPFDVLQAGYQIKFVPRGGASVASVAESELGATDGKQLTRLTSVREMDSQLPRRVELTYFDVAREYDTGEQAAERLNTDAINTLKIELPIVLNATEAAGMAEVLLYLYWLERNDLSFVLPPTFQQLQPADVVTITALGGEHEVRLTSINSLPDGRMECAGKYNNAAVYVPTAVGEEPLAPGQTLTTPGPTDLTMLDVPCVSEAMDQPGFLAAACGYNSGWKGATVYETADGGQTWSAVAGFTIPGSVLGTARDTLGAGRYDIIDPVGRLTFQAVSGSLSSVSESALLAGANTFAYGAHGRWEIIGAKTCTQNTDGSWSLGNLLRGRFGTEWAASLHAAGDAIVLLNSATPFVGQVTSSIGAAKTFRGVTSGRGIDTASDLSFTYQGANLECVAPVYLNGSRNVSTLDWTLTWVRRTRVGGEWRDFVDAPLGEPAENYVIEIWSDSSYTTLKRTLTSTTTTKTYTNAQQITDFGETMATLYVKIYQVSATVGRGIPLIASISRGVAPLTDHLWNYVSSLLHFDLGDSNTFIDVKSSKVVTPTGGAYVSDAWSPFGGGSGWFDGANGSNSRITLADSDDWHFNGAFTVSFRIKPSEIKATDQWLFLQAARTGDACPLRINLNSAGKISVLGSADNVSWLFTDIDSTTTVAANDEIHIAVTDDGTTLRLFINGALEDSRATWTRTNSSQSLHIGGAYDSGDREYHGSMSDLFVLKGKAKWTAAFTVPSTKFSSSDSDWSYCVLSLPMEFGLDPSNFFDEKGKTWTRSGTPTISATQSRFGGSSGYFTGSQYITTPNHADFNFGASDFCIEWSTYYSTVPGGSSNPQAIIRKWTTASQQCWEVWMYYTGSGNTEFRFSISTTGSDTVTALSSSTGTDSWAIPANTWTKWAIFRYGNTLYFTVDGVVKKSVAFTSTIFAGTSQVEFGNGDGSSGAVFYAEEFRITKTGRYSGAYAPIAAPFPNA